MPDKVNQKRRRKIPKVRYRVENWRDYDAAPPPVGRLDGVGAPAAIAVETGLLMRLAFGRPWRQTEGRLASILRLLGLNLPVSDHTTFSMRCIATSSNRSTRLPKNSAHRRLLSLSKTRRLSS
jgi:hypothetical protein